MAECSTPLRELSQSFSLNESSVTAVSDTSLHQKIESLLEKVGEIEKEISKKQRSFGVKPSKQCAHLVRQTYRSMEASNGWDLKVGFNTPENMMKTALLLDECKIIAEKYEFSSEELQVAAKTFYRTLHDRLVRQERGKLQDHKLSNKKNDRIRRKLKTRQTALSKIEWSERRKAKVRAVMSVGYMSSEESGSDDSLCIKRLQWESKRLIKYKKKLDRVYLEGMSVKSLRFRRQRRRGEQTSDRECPEDIPSWAVSTVDESLPTEADINTHINTDTD